MKALFARAGFMRGWRRCSSRAPELFSPADVGSGPRDSSYGSCRKGNPMRFMMFVCSDAEPDAEPERPGEIEAWCDDVDGRGKRPVGDRLRPAKDARTGGGRGGRRQVTER